MVGNTGTLMTMRIVRNKVRSRDDSTVPTVVTTDSDDNKDDNDNNNNKLQHKQQLAGIPAQQPQQPPPSNFNRGHKHLSISFRLPKNHHYIDESSYGTGKSRFFTANGNPTSYDTGRSRFFTLRNNHNNNNNKNNITKDGGTGAASETGDNNGGVVVDTNNEQVVGFTRTSGIGVMPSNTWVFPPNAPTPNIYHCLNTEELMAANDNGGFKGFRKQFSGRFKRLVAAKKPETTPVIPPHLKPQLKTIYVY